MIFHLVVFGNSEVFTYAFIVLALFEIIFWRNFKVKSKVKWLSIFLAFIISLTVGLNINSNISQAAAKNEPVL